MVIRLPLHHHTSDRRINRQSAFHLTSLFQRFDFCGADIPKQQPLSRGLKQIIGTAGYPWKRAVLQDRVRFQCKQIFLLCCNKVRAVDREEWFTRFDRFADIINKHLFDETRHLRMDMR